MKILEGNIVNFSKEGRFDVVFHGCNCHHVMGAGVARVLRDAFPEIYERDKATAKCNLKMGTFSEAYIREQNCKVGMFVILNMYTQEIPGPFFDIVAFERCVVRMIERYGNRNLRFGFPKIGSGIGGGNWEEIQGLIERYLKGEDATLVVYKL